MEAEEVLAKATLNGLGYACVLTLAALAIHLLLRTSFSSSNRRYLFAAVLVFLVSSTVLCITRTLFYWSKLLAPNQRKPIQYAAIILHSRLNYCLNDFLVVWRARALTDRPILRKMLGISLGISATTVTAEAVLAIQHPGNWGSPLFFIPLIINNLFATIVVLHKTRIYRKQIRERLVQTRQNQKCWLQRALSLLIGFGFAYCGWWIIYIICNMARSPPLLGSIITTLSPYIAAIYPLLIILVIENQKANGPQITETENFVLPPRDSNESGFEISIIESLENDEKADVLAGQ